MQFSWAVGELPQGRSGPATLRYIKRFAQQDAKTPEVRLLALELTRDEVSYDRRGEAEAIHRFVRDEIRYVRDIAGIETVQSPRFTLRVGAGDCDDKTALAASLLYSIGFRVRYVLACTNPAMPGRYSHIYPETEIDGRWCALETIVPGAPFGWAVRHRCNPYREE